MTIPSPATGYTLLDYTDGATVRTETLPPRNMALRIQDDRDGYRHRAITVYVDRIVSSRMDAYGMAVDVQICHWPVEATPWPADVIAAHAIILAQTVDIRRQRAARLDRLLAYIDKLSDPVP